MSLLFCSIKIPIIAFKSMSYHTVKLICINNTGQKKILDTPIKIQRYLPVFIYLTTECYYYFYLNLAIGLTLQTHHCRKGNPVRLALTMFLVLSFFYLLHLIKFITTKFNLTNLQLVFFITIIIFKCKLF